MIQPASATETVRHLTGLAFVIARPKRLGVAVSGGGDSMALLDVMCWHGGRLGFAVEAVTVDHGLRPEAKAEAQAVADYCAARGVPHHTLSWEWDGCGNLQAAARTARYALIANWAGDRSVDMVALGHTRDDQAETFLMRLARAAGVDGLAEMERHFDRHGITWIRPLLSLPREDLRAYLRDRGVAWADDPSNEDERFERVRMRGLMSQLASVGITAEKLAASSMALGMARSALAHCTAQEAETVATEQAGDILLDTRQNPPLHPEIQRRLLIAALRHVSGADYPPRETALAALDAALSVSGKGTVQGCVVTRDNTGTVRIAREYAAVAGLVTATTEAWDRRWYLQGPHAEGLELRALGEAGLRACPDWRACGLPRGSLLASPSVWRGEDLLAAPLAGWGNGWIATLRPSFTDFLVTH